MTKSQINIILQKLACPVCKSGLEMDKPNNRLICRRCSLAYRIDHEIPVLLENEAEKIDKELR